jgi:hypothetical protein
VIDGVGAAVKVAEACWRWDWRRASAAATPRADTRADDVEVPQPVDLLIVHGTLITVDAGVA